MSFLPDPDRPPMTPLPAELLAHILKLAQEDEPLSVQFKIRLQFEHVCRAWYMCDNKWRIVSIDGFDQVQALLDTMAALRPKEVKVGKGKKVKGGAKAKAKAGAAAEASAGESRIEVVDDIALSVKSLHIRLSGAKGKKKGAAISKLLSMMSNISSIHFAIGYAGLGRGGNCLGKEVTAAVVKLSDVKHFNLSGGSSEWGSAWISNEFLMELIPNWTKLESLTLRNCATDYNTSLSAAFDHAPAFSSIDLRDSWDRTQPSKSILGALPLTTRELKLNASDMYLNECNWSALNRTKFADEIAPNLTAVSLLDGEGARLKTATRTAARGRFDTFINNLTSVAHLQIGPSAVSDLARLADLRCLTHLDIIRGVSTPTPRPLASTEFVALFDDSTSLKSITVSSKLTQTWSAMDIREVEDAARGKVDLKWLYSS